ncbi:MAG TPA: penicillin-binding protein 2 [Vicinamibacteria bacterium]
MKIYEDLRPLQRRLVVLQAVMVTLMVVLLGYFWHLQVLRGRHYRELAENNRLRALPIPAPRGAIFDRKGRILAENRSSFNVVVTTERRQDLVASLGRLDRLIDFDVSEVEERLGRKGPRFRSLVVKADANEEEVAVVEARRLEYPETSVDVVPLRAYPLGEGTAHVLGYVGEITDRQMESETFAAIEPGSVVGQAGIELEYNRALMGRDGMRRIIVNSRGLEVREEEKTSPTDGPYATLNLDLDLQKAVVEAMKGQAGSVVALDPRTGEVLAYYSAPAYDPNLFSSGIKPEDWSRLVKDPAKPLMNRPIQGGYAPGSTFKIVNALAALQERVITPATRFHCPGYLAIYNTLFRCHKPEGHGSVDLRRAISLSCNVYFYNVGVRLEIERLSRWAKAMGLSAPTGIDLPHEASGLFQDPEWKMRALKVRWYPSETVSVSIGQAMTVTPLQLARVAAVVASGGKLARPHLMRAIGGKAVPVDPPRDLGLRPEVVAAVREAMVSVVAEGTGQRAKLEGVAVAGKTGSAQVVSHARLEADRKARELQPHGWFMCFAPADNPRVAMAVLVEHGTAGGTSAAPVAGQVLARWFGVRAIGPGMQPPADTVPAPPVPQVARAAAPAESVPGPQR